MMKILLTIGLITLLFSCNNTEKDEKHSSVSDKLQTENPNKNIENYLNVAGPIKYNQNDYHLAFSTNSPVNFYSQEYVIEGDDIEKFNQLIFINLILGEVSAKDAALRKVKELESRKSTDVLVNYELTENNERGEILLDFILSDGNEDEKMIVEWNAYRYINYTDKSGKTGVLLLGLSKRDYGLKYIEFLSDLKINRKRYNTSFVELDIPEININK